MIYVKGKKTKAKIFTNSPQHTAIDQIEELCDQEFMEDLKVRIMPDYHAGKGCVIGTTIEIKDKVVPNLVGVDIGCGITTMKIKNKEVDYSKLDNVIRKYIPGGKNVHEDIHISRHVPRAESHNFKAHVLSDVWTNKSLGTLGGGNHFIELSVDEEKNCYLTVHTGSRYVGAKISRYYQNQAVKSMKNIDVKLTIDKLKAEGRHTEIERIVQEVKKNQTKIPKDLAYVEGKLFTDYLHDIKLTQEYAVENRKYICETIVDKMGWVVEDSFDTIHNYIDTDTMILRKGAVSAEKGERLVIPINMRDGSIIGIGKGNEDWNYSSPHGAGRLLSRRKAKDQLDMEEFKETMKGVWSTSVGYSTLDEAPNAYKSMQEIVDMIGDTVEIVKIIKPVYNFKATE